MLELAILGSMAMACLTILRITTILVEARAPRSVPPQEADPMPTDLLMWAHSDSERWAREDKTRYAYQLYEEQGDWDKVAQILKLADN